MSSTLPSICHSSITWQEEHGLDLFYFIHRVIGMERRFKNSKYAGNTVYSCFMQIKCKLWLIPCEWFYFRQTEITNLGSLLQIFQAVVENKHLEVSGSPWNLLSVWRVERAGSLLWQPAVELAQPVLDGVDGHDDEHRLGLSVPQEVVRKGAHLEQKKK